MAPKLQFSPINENFRPRKHIKNETKGLIILVGRIFPKTITKGSVNQVNPYSNELWNTILNYETAELNLTTWSIIDRLLKQSKVYGMKMTENACVFK